MLVAGIDIGSTATKAVILADGRWESSALLETGANSQRAAEQALEEALGGAGRTRAELAAVVATGYGRVSCPFATRRVTEITCHGRGAAAALPAARTVIDIGGQDAKVIRLDEGGLVTDFIMNDKCAAGTGRFLEVMARRLEFTLPELGEAAARSRQTVAISSTCTVFAESEVIGLIALGRPREEIARGLCESIADRVVGMAQRVGVVDEVLMTGGVAQNPGVRRALERRLGVPIRVPERAQYMGAYGAALIALDLAGLLR